MLKNLLLLSSSRVAETDYLQHALPFIKSFLDNVGQKPQKLLFIPYAGIAVGFDQYLNKVREPFSQLDIEVVSIHQFKNKTKAIEEANGIVVGGGNTFALLNSLYQDDIIPSIQQSIISGTPYIGWSAGSNIAAPTICTTNDMPIVEPPSFNAFNFLPWQINPHYIEGNPPGHNGETRQQRIEEYLIANPSQKVIAIPEGTALQLQNGQLDYLATSAGYLFDSKSKNKFDDSRQLNQLLEQK